MVVVPWGKKGIFTEVELPTLPRVGQQSGCGTKQGVVYCACDLFRAIYIVRYLHCLLCWWKAEFLNAQLHLTGGSGSRHLCSITTSFLPSFLLSFLPSFLPSFFSSFFSPFYLMCACTLFRVRVCVCVFVALLPDVMSAPGNKVDIKQFLLLWL